MTLAALLLALMPSTGGEVVDDVEIAQIQHVYDSTGNEILTQVIWWEWNRADLRMDVIDWRLLRDPKMRPQKNYTTGKYEMIWYDGAVLRRVRAGAIIEDWSMHDEELRQRHVLPVDRRKKLTQPYTVRSE